MIRTTIENLDPVNFAFVMATGVISFQLFLMQWHILSLLFLIVATAAYVCLGLLFIIRFFLSGKSRQNSSLNRLKWLTFSAGSCDLAIRYTWVDANVIGMILGVIGIVTGVFLIYSIFCGLLFQSRGSIESISPLWLLMSIASHYAAFTINIFWEKQLIASPLLLLVSFGLWSLGILFYLLYMPLNIYRMFFVRFEGEHLHPAYWTCMGAAAIAAVSGSRLLMTEHHPHFIDTAMPFIQGMVLMMWAWATAMIPLLFCIEGWKYASFKMPFRYEPSLWAMVFPFGMYTAATHLLPFSVGIDFLQGIVLPLLGFTIALWSIIIVLKLSFEKKVTFLKGSFD